MNESSTCDLYPFLRFIESKELFTINTNDLFNDKAILGYQKWILGSVFISLIFIIIAMLIIYTVFN